MRIIDARTGDDVTIGEKLVYDSGVIYNASTGETIHEEPGWYRILEVKDYGFTARALVEGNKMAKQWLPLRVRVTHPGFFLQRVAFVPT